MPVSRLMARSWFCRMATVCLVWTGLVAPVPASAEEASGTVVNVSGMDETTPPMSDMVQLTGGVQPSTATVSRSNASAAPSSRSATKDGRPATEGTADGLIRSLAQRWLGSPEKVDPDAPNVAFETAKGSSASTLLKQASADLPLAQLTADQRGRAESVLSGVSYYRRLPTLTFPVDPDVYLYFTKNPEVAVSLWRAMNISKLDLSKVSDTVYEGDTNDGTHGTMEVLHRGLRVGDVDKCLVYCEGTYTSPILPKPIFARSLLLLETRFFRETNGQVYVTHRGDLFVCFPSETVEAVSKMMTPVTTVLTDRTFGEVSLFLKLMSIAMAKRPDWVEQIAGKMQEVKPEQRSDFLALAAHVYVTSNRDILAKALQTKSDRPARVVEVSEETPRAPSRQSESRKR